MSDQPQPPARIYAKWVPEVGEWDLWDEHYGHDDEAYVYVPAEQSDELVAACEALIAYRDKVGPLSFQLEKADDFINAMRLAVEKAGGEQ